jgi:hypothetical protein
VTRDVMYFWVTLTWQQRICIAYGLSVGGVGSATITFCTHFDTAQMRASLGYSF